MIKNDRQYEYLNIRLYLYFKFVSVRLTPIGSKNILKPSKKHEIKKQNWKAHY